MRSGRHSGLLDQQGKAIVERLGGAWSKSGGMCRCPAHDDHSPSLSIRVGNRRLLFHCFAGCETVWVIRSLQALRLLGPELNGGERDARGVAAFPNDLGAAARRLWAAARSIGGSPAELYLRGRGLTIPAHDLRYLARTPYGLGTGASLRPALLAAVRDASGLVAIHRTFLDPLQAELAGLSVQKRALGPLGVGAVRLGPPQRGTLGLAEGIESAMSATMLTGVPCWATLGCERFGRVALPAAVHRLILFLDNDRSGHRAEKLARDAHRTAAVGIEARYPHAPGCDWNDVLVARDAGPDLGPESGGDRMAAACADRWRLNWRELNAQPAHPE
jgi:hypothetical protein